MSVHHMYAWCLRKPENGTGAPRTGVIDDYKLPCGSSGRAVKDANH